MMIDPITAWQTELACEAEDGGGIDALYKILSAIKNAYAQDDVALLSAVDEMRDCADRHLTKHSHDTVDAIFRAVFPTLNGSLDSIATNLDAEQEISRLASLPLVQYERDRIAAAGKLGMRASALDTLVKAARPAENKGQVFDLHAIEPWPSEVDGAKLLDDISEAIKRYLVLPSNSVHTLALWAVHTHCFNCFTHSPRAAIVSPEKGCGKTTTLDVLGTLVARPLPTANATTSAIFRIIASAQPTLLIDEADTFLKENDELRGILNAGHRRGGQVMRTVGDDHEPRQFPTYGPAAIAMIGHLPETLYDRSVVISLRRRRPDERIESFRCNRTEQLRILARKAARWAADHQSRLTDSDPDMGELMNRFADNWRPLFAIADEAGGEWPARARKNARDADAAKTEQSVSVLLLMDIRDIFDAQETDRMSSGELVAGLTAIEGRPWAEWKNGKPITQNGLARQLNKFEVFPGTIRLDGNMTAKGYYRLAFEEAFSRYLPSQAVTPSQANNNGHCDALQSVTPDKAVTLSETSQAYNHGHCDVVTLSNTPIRRMGSIDL
jgi:putative DNA primase/helicase